MIETPTPLISALNGSVIAVDDLSKPIPFIDFVNSLISSSEIFTRLFFGFGIGFAWRAGCCEGGGFTE
jgi:hypothetical protein